MMYSCKRGLIWNYHHKFVINLELSVQANMICLLIIMTRKYIQTNKNTEIDLQIKSLNFSGHLQ